MEINSLFAFLVESYLNAEIKVKIKRNEKKTAVSRDKIQSTGVQYTRSKKHLVHNKSSVISFIYLFLFINII